MSRQEMACGTCHAPLNTYGDPPTYLHPTSMASDGHPPEPVPAATLDTIARRCDFCSDSYPVWALHSNKAISVLAVDDHGSGLAQDYGHTWAACATCEHLATNRDVNGLAARAAAAMGRDHDRQTLRHIAEFHQTFLHHASGRRSLITTAWPPGNITARDLPKVRDRLAGLYRGDHLPRPYTGQVRTLVGDGLLAARLYWIDPEFTTLAAHAAAHLPDLHLHPDEIPATSGLLVWAQPVTGRQTAAAWHLDTDTGAFRIVCHRHIGTGLDAPAIQRIREQVGWLAPTRLVELTEGQTLPAGGPAAPLVATWLLITQKAAETLPVELDRATRRAYARQQRPTPQVHLVRIRTRTDHHTRGGSGQVRAPLKEREWVGGHWKHQAYGPKHSRRRLIYIHPYIRGPQHAPVRAASTVRVLGSIRTRDHPTNQ